MVTKKQTKSLPDELQDVATTGQLSDLEAHLNKAYSSERYEEFQTAVEKIIHKELTTDEAKKKLNDHIDGRIKKMLDNRAWKSKSFWVPTALAIIAIIATIIDIYTKKHGG